MEKPRKYTGKPGNLLYYKGNFDKFLSLGDNMRTIGTMSLPVVFSSSMPFCAPGINALMSMGVPVYGCGYISTT